MAARARQIANEAEYAEEMLDDKPVSIAIREIADGKVPDLSLPEKEPTDMETAFLKANTTSEDNAAEAPDPEMESAAPASFSEGPDTF